MNTLVRILKYVIAVVLVAVLGGAASWFFYVRSHQQSIASSSATASGRAPTSAYNAPLSTAAGESSPTAAAASTSSAPEISHATTRLWRVDEGPVSGFSFIAPPKTASSSIHLYLIERANGNVLDADAPQHTVQRLTNTLIPKVYEAVFAPKGGSVFVRTLESGAITTLLASFPTPASTTTFPQALGGPMLPANIRALAIDPNPQSATVFYLASSAQGGVDGTLTTIAGGKPKILFSSPLDSWRPLIAQGHIILLEAPSDGVPGYAYTLSDSGALSLYAGPLPGLQIAPHPTENALLFSSASGGLLSLFAQVGTNAPTALPVHTIAEKCAWAPLNAKKDLIAYCAVPQQTPQSGFIDRWYQGVEHTSDSWWRIDVRAGTAELLYTPDQSFDVHDPQIDTSGAYIAFTNGVDESLWVLRIVQ